MGAAYATREILSITDMGECITDVGEWEGITHPGGRLWKIRYRVRRNKKGPRPETYVTQDFVVAKDELDAVLALNRVLKEQT